MAELMPEMINTGKLKEIQTVMRKDLRTAAKTLRGKHVFFVAAADVKLSDKTKINLFVVSKTEAEAKAWQLKLKGVKPSVLSTGTCTLATKDGKNVSVSLENIKGDRKAATKVAKLAFKIDTAVQVKDAQAEEEGQEEAHEQAIAAAAALGVRPAEIKDLAEELGMSEDEVEELMAEHGAAIGKQLDSFMAQVEKEVLS